MGRDPNKFLYPELIERFLAGCAAEGHNVIITRTDTTFEEQRALFAQGRDPLPLVNALRKAAKMAPITAEENRRCVTWTMNSLHFPDRHGRSHAFDFGIIHNGKYITNAKADIDEDQIPDYVECAMIGERLGLVSGRHFRNPDLPHLQLAPQNTGDSGR